MGRSKRKAKRVEDETSSRPSKKPAGHAALPAGLAPVLPPGVHGRDSLSGLVLEVQTLLEDRDGDAMLAAHPVLTRKECASWMSWGDATGFASESHSASKHVAVRDNGRIAVESHAVAGAIFERLRPWLPAEVRGRSLRGCNPNLRVYRYSPGQRFGRHVDQAARVDGVSGGVTEFTVLIYLNDEGLEGGETVFYASHDAPEPLVAFTPRAGSALVHAHGARCLTHEGSQVQSGVKYLLRTDVAYA